MQAVKSAGDQRARKMRKTRLKNTRVPWAKEESSLVEHEVLWAEWAVCWKAGWCKEDSHLRVTPLSWVLQIYYPWNERESISLTAQLFIAIPWMCNS